MPCTITGSLLGDAELHLTEAREIAHARNAWLCEVMGIIEQMDYKTAALVKDKLSPELKQWWEEHKKQDEEERKREEAAALKHKGVTMEEVP